MTVDETRLETVTMPADLDTTEFVLADAAKLGFPVFPKPISAPKITLGTFPKVGLNEIKSLSALGADVIQVTAVFAPNNAGDTKFPRREKVRSWKLQERSVSTVSGGLVKFKTWHRGECRAALRLSDSLFPIPAISCTTVRLLESEVT